MEETTTMTTEERAWAAGLFEGEGSIRINKATKRNLGHLVVSVTNTDREILDFFQARWPGHMKPTRGLRVDQREAWQWLTAANKAAAFLCDLMPFFQTSRVIEKAKFALDYQGDKSSLKAVYLSDRYREEQFNAYLWMKELNVRGVTERVCR